MNSDSETGHPHGSPKLRRPKSRDVSSRYLSQSSLSSPERKFDLPSPRQTLSPRQKPPRSSNDTRRQRSFGGSSDDDSGLIRGLWPAPTPIKTSSSSKKLDTFGDYLGKERLKDLKIDNKNNEVKQNIENPLFEYEMTGGKIAKENHKSFFGGSMRLGFPRRSSKTPASKSSYYSPNLSGNETGIAPGRFSVDETTLRRRSLGPASDTADSGSECSDVSSGYRSGFSGKTPGKNPSLGSFKSPTANARRSGVEVSSKYLQDLRAKTRVGTPDPNVPILSSLDKSPSIRTSKSSAVYGGGPAAPKWAMSPGREVLPPVDSRGKPPPAFSNLRPKGKGVGDLLSKGLGLFKGKKSTAAAAEATDGGSAPVASAVVGGLAVGYGGGESVHELRLMDTRLIQWSFVNARGAFVNLSMTNKAESKFIGAWHSITKLQHSVVQKKLQLDKEKLEMKLSFILHSHIKSLEAWGDIQAQNLSAVSGAKDSFHSAICRVPLVDGAKVMDPHSAYLALQHAANLATSINSMLYTISPTAKKTITLISELAKVVRQEKALLQEFLELLRIISTLEIQERSLKCSLIQIK
ncbi:QWRF motif-containing protein 3-like [Rhododendron vialii]|uniref:QWRF motif-containing protein 3-like n=1 Tax=Rhododendron vialii TaxID=182163 RepID=UPI00265D679E|nr:QWRF motif-containing protein 3-like [Rhododendron vialii]